MNRTTMPPTSTTFAVDSSWIASVTYAADATLTVRFRRGTVYRFFRVPGTIVEALLAAPSKGAYFTRHIRTAFPYTQIIEPRSRS